MELVLTLSIIVDVSGQHLTWGFDIGPEVVAEAVKILKAISDASTSFELKLESHAFGGNAIDSVGEPLPAVTLKACQEADAILMGELCKICRCFLFGRDALTLIRFRWWTKVGCQQPSPT